MLTLLLAVACAVLISFICSLLEAALYALPWSTIEQLRSSERTVGRLLFEMRSNVDKPIAAILTLNTVANTAGATIAGGAFTAVFGSDYMGIFAASFTLLILSFGEIIPKTLGVAKATSVCIILARPLHFMIRLLSPIIWLSGLLTRKVAPGAKTPTISEADLLATAGLSLRAGGIKPYEARFIKNVLALDQKHVHEIMTPRTVIFSLPENLTVAQAYTDPRIWHFSRIPVYGHDKEDLLGLVQRRTLAQYLKEKQEDVTLATLMQPLHFVQESQTLDRVLREMLNSHVHLFVALDEYGGIAGVVSLEDILEEILGWEIVDESDNVADLRALARERRLKLTKNS